MKEQIVTWLPASHLLSAGQLPPNSEVCCDHAVANSNGYSGVLIRNTKTGIYSLWTATVAVSINQQYAYRIHEHYQRTSPEPLTVREICAAANLTQSALAARFGIPKRTVENWCSGANKCPDYTRRMMCELLGLLSRPEA